MTSKALVGPIRWPKGIIRFSGGPRGNRQWFEPALRVQYTPPADTCDPRYRECTDHHVACDCREAEFAEERKEVRYEIEERNRVVDRVLAGHATYVDNIPGEGCMCTGCQIARALGWHWTT